MSYTDIPPGPEHQRPSCPSCGGFQWAYAGYCQTLACAGHYLDPDYPKSMPQWMKDERDAREAAKGKPTAKKKVSTKVKMPRKGTRRSTELWYESQGKVAPWLEKERSDPNAS